MKALSLITFSHRKQVLIAIVTNTRGTHLGLGWKWGSDLVASRMLWCRKVHRVFKVWLSQVAR